MKRQLLRLLGGTLILINAPGLCASLEKEPLSWTGAYVGGFLGGAFGNYKTNANTGSVTDTSYLGSTADINAVNASGSQSRTPGSFIIGIQAGDNWAWHNTVFGAVIDYSSFYQRSNINSGVIQYPDNSDFYTFQSVMKTDWLFTLRGKIGRQFDAIRPSFLYFTGGMAITKLFVTNEFNDTVLDGTGGLSSNTNQIGWTVGLGFETALREHLSLTAEYLYVQIPSVTNNSTIYNSAAGFGIPVNSLVSPFLTTTNFYSNLLKIGLNYRF